MRAVVGLGNPGASYRNTRHNVGFMVLDGMVEGRFKNDVSHRESGLTARFAAAGFKKNPGPYLTVEGETEGTRFLMVKPTTFMNESGRAVSSLVTKGVLQDPGELLVVLDDVDLEFGRMRVRGRGSAGGHKGLKSIIAALGSEEFARLRIGVGPRPGGAEMVDYVLGTFRPEENALMESVLQAAARVVSAWIGGDSGEAAAELERIQFQNG